MRACLLATKLTPSDAASYDVLFQFRTLRDAGRFDSLELFADSSDIGEAADLRVGTASEFREWCETHPDGLVIFHYTDGQSQFAAGLCSRAGPTVVRWQNATPPWFTLVSEPILARHALAGYETIVRFVHAPAVTFWPSSDFTRQQLIALGASAERCRVVNPATRFLEHPEISRRPAASPGSTLKLLFVSRIAPNKGHAHAVAVASRVRALSGCAVRLVFVGRSDPGLKTFNADLAAAVRSSDAEVEFKGVVSDDELAACYLDADVLLSMSEHEGFGLPVMEAMKSGLPVVARAVTASAELLRGHPFAFAVFDLDLFAAAILTLRDRSAHRRILDVQAELLTRYTAEGIRRQLDDAARSALGETVDTGRIDPAGTGSVDEKLRAALAVVTSLDDRPAGPVHDSGQNLVSRYDLKHYPAIVDALKRRKFAPLERSEHDGAVLVRPDEFSAPSGELEADGRLHFPERTYDARHLVYGPYLDIPDGDYVATVRFTATASSGRHRFELDVSCPRRGVLTSTIASAPGPMSRESATLAFSVSEADGPVEFRLRPAAAFTGSLTFDGVVLRARSGVLRRSKRLTRPTVFASAVVNALKRLVTSKAKLSFRSARGLAEARRWQDAAAAYKAGLAEQPDNFAARVQLGHALKESGKVAEAEAEYHAALRQRPDDADLNLQLGHLYKIGGDAARATEYYRRALASSPSARDATLELVRMKVPVEDWLGDAD